MRILYAFTYPSRLPTNYIAKTEASGKRSEEVDGKHVIGCIITSLVFCNDTWHTNTFENSVQLAIHKPQAYPVTSNHTQT